MKKIILLLILSFFFYSFYAQSDDDIEIVYKNGDIKYGKGHLRSDYKVLYYSYKKRNKEIIVPFNELKEVYFFYQDYKTKFVSKKVSGEKYNLILKELEIGKLSLYVYYEMNKRKYYIQEKGSEEVTYIKIGLSNKKFKERLIPYIEDCNELLIKIDEKNFKIRQIIRFYNSHCGIKQKLEITSKKKI